MAILKTHNHRGNICEEGGILVLRHSNQARVMAILKTQGVTLCQDTLTTGPSPGYPENTILEESSVMKVSLCARTLNPGPGHGHPKNTHS
jgi:hypothetical protein